MSSELCKSCIHTSVCHHDKNLVGDVFVAGHPFVCDNDALYERFIEWKNAGFPCEDYFPSVVRCRDCKRNADNGGIYPDGRTMCPIQRTYGLLQDGYCYLGEKFSKDTDAEE